MNNSNGYVVEGEETVVYFYNLLLTRVYIEEMIYVFIENGL